MAKPAFIYAFDNLGAYRFVELCAELLGARYKGFILGGVGPDGGIDAEIDNVLGEWHNENRDSLSNLPIEAGQMVIFQFKHIVAARVGGQQKARQKLLALYKGKNSEVSKDLVAKKTPDVYVLMTNVEINSQFRNKFQETCKEANPHIQHYQIIGLDELENWVTQSTNLRHLYFPTIFDLPRYNLKLDITQGFAAPNIRNLHKLKESEIEALIQINVYNIGMLPSYVSTISFKVIEDGQEKYLQLLSLARDPIMEAINPKKGEPLEPGRNATYHFRTSLLKHVFGNKFLSEIMVTDEILNRYSVPIPEDIKQRISEDQNSGT